MSWLAETRPTRWRRSTVILCPAVTPLLCVATTRNSARTRPRRRRNEPDAVPGPPMNSSCPRRLVVYPSPNFFMMKHASGSLFASSRWLGLFSFLVLTQPGRADDWPQWRGPDRDGISKETRWLTD